MSLIKCLECGRDISDKADKCPNCGCPTNANCSYQNDSYLRPYEPKPKNSILGILAIIFSIFVPTFIIGTILAVIDLIKKDGKKKTCSYIAIGICILWVFLFFMNSMISESENETISNSKQVEENLTLSKENKKENEKMKDNHSYSERNENILNAGIYIIGEDLIAGKYDFTAIKGSGSVKIYNSYEEYLDDEHGFHALSDYDMKEENASVGMLNEDIYSQTISNIRLEEGQCFVIEKGLEIEYTLK